MRLFVRDQGRLIPTPLPPHALATVRGVKRSSPVAQSAREDFRYRERTLSAMRADVPVDAGIPIQ